MKREVIPNDKVIPFIEGESIFSLVVMSSMAVVKDYFRKDQRKAWMSASTSMYQLTLSCIKTS